MYKHNKKNKSSMVLWAILGLLVGFYVGVSMFIWGFERGAFSGPMELKQTQATAPVNCSQLHVTANTTASQSYNDAAYFIQPSVIPHDTTTTKLVNDTLTINKTIVDLIKESYNKEPLPRFLEDYTNGGW